jgi:hypothetical protein
MKEKLIVALTACLAGFGALAHGLASDSQTRTTMFSLLNEGIETAFLEKNSVDDLAEVSDLVVLGRIVDVTDGRTIGAPEGDHRGLHTVVLKVEVDMSLKGGSSQVIFVELSVAR